jgi:nucleoid-associated protein YgaU
MNTQVKVGIAAAIVAALVALIVLDQRTSPKDDAAQKASAGGDPATIVGTNSGAEAASPRLGEEDIKKLLQSAEKQFGDQSSKPAGSQTPTKGTEERNEKRVSSTATGEEYVIKPGDTLEKIAQKHKTTAAKILEANPGLKATALRVDKSIKLPKAETAPIEKKDEAPVFVQDPAPKTEVKVEPAPKTETTKVVDGKKTYTVQPGDTLSGISVKVYNTSRHYQKIYEANKDAIEDPNTLQVGLNLVMPDLPSKTATANTGAPGTGAVPTTVTPLASVPAGAKSVTVNPGDRLWNIAAKFAAERKVGILDMIKIIVDANVDKKIREDGSNLQAGWQLIIPE